MIDPSTIDPAMLPSVPLSDRSQLPSEPCIYFAIDGQGVVQYIGRSVNPMLRWRDHHRCNQLSSMGGVRIAYLFVDADLLPSVEEALIEWFNPPLNRQKIIRVAVPIGELLSNAASQRRVCSPSRLTFGQWLKLNRDRVGLSQQGLADALGFTRQTVSNWERDNGPAVSLFAGVKIASLFEVPLDLVAKAAANEIEVEG